MGEQSTEFTELDALLRAGILTADEHAQARRKLATRSPHGKGHGANGHAPNGHGSNGHANGHGGPGSVHVVRSNGTAVRQPQRSNGGRGAVGATTVQRREPGPAPHFAPVQAVPARIAPPRQPVRPPRPAVPPPNGLPHSNGFPRPVAQQPMTQQAAEPTRTSVMTLPTRDPETAERPRPPGARGRHHRQTAPQWPWVVIAVFVVVSTVVVGIAVSHRGHHATRAGGSSHPASHAANPQADQVPPPNVVEGSKVDVPVSINVNGADATVTVSKLTALPAAANSRTVTYQSTVTALGVYGTFPLDKANFTAQSQTGGSYHAQAGSRTPLAKNTVTAGVRVAGTIQFTLPRGQTVQTVLFTTSLGEQLGIWTTY